MNAMNEQPSHPDKNGGDPEDRQFERLLRAGLPVGGPDSEQAQRMLVDFRRRMRQSPAAGRKPSRRRWTWLAHAALWLFIFAGGYLFGTRGADRSQSAGCQPAGYVAPRAEDHLASLPPMRLHVDDSSIAMISLRLDKQ